MKLRQSRTLGDIRGDINSTRFVLNFGCWAQNKILIFFLIEFVNSDRMDAPGMCQIDGNDYWIVVIRLWMA